MAERPTATLVRKNKARGIMTWYARLAYQKSGVVRHVSMRTEMKGEAKRTMLEMLNAGEWDATDKDVLTVGRLVDAFLRDAETRNVKKDSIGMYREAFSFLAPLSERSLRELGRNEVAEAFERKYGESKPCTWNHRRGVTSSLFRFATNRMDYPNNLASAIPRRRSAKAPKEFWSMEQIRRILDDAPSPEMRLLWSLMAYAGLRIHEAIKCKPSDLREGRLHVVGKGSKAAALPISSLLREEVSRLPDWSFEGMTREKSRLALVKAAKEFGGAPTNHRFRHSFASNLIRGGANVKAVQLLMRHSTIQMTLDVYSHLLEGDLGSEIDKISNAK